MTPPPRRTSRDEPLLREVRWRLSRDEALAARLRRIARMEQSARVWVNGQELGAKQRYSHLSASYD